jgi:hypothetical protein
MAFKMPRFMNTLDLPNRTAIMLALAGSEWVPVHMSLILSLRLGLGTDYPAELALALEALELAAEQEGFDSWEGLEDTVSDALAKSAVLKAVASLLVGLPAARTYL